MESIKLPLREIYKRYTKSELAIQAWRSSEVSYQMHQSTGGGAKNGATGAPTSPQLPDYGASDPMLRALEDRLGPTVVAKLDEDLDLRKLTGDEALRYLGAVGVPIGGRILR